MPNIGSYSEKEYTEKVLKNHQFYKSCEIWLIQISGNAYDEYGRNQIFSEPMWNAKMNTK